MNKINKLTLENLKDFVNSEDVYRYFRINNKQCPVLMNSSIGEDIVRLNFGIDQGGRIAKVVNLLCSSTECRTLQGEKAGLLTDIWVNFLQNVSTQSYDL